MNPSIHEQPYVVVDCANALGESPLWCASEGALYWLDILSNELWRYDHSNELSVRRTLTQTAGNVVLCEDGRLLLAYVDGIGLYDWRTGKHEYVADYGCATEPMRPNEGRCDPAGRFWFGTMSLSGEQSVGSLFRMDHRLKPIRIIDGLRVPNTLVWSPDARSMYLADSAAREIYRFDYDFKSGDIRDRSLFATSKGEAVPDGSAMDVEGRLWNAQWDGGCIICYSPEGLVLREVGLPISRPTSCTFGGADWSTLFITSARVGLTRQQLVQEPLAGSVFSIKLPVSGLPDQPFRLHGEV